MKKENKIKECVKGGDNKISSKRVVSILSFVLIAIAFVSNLFWNIKIDEHIYDGMLWVTIGGLGFVATEKFSKFVKNSKSS